MKVSRGMRFTRELFSVGNLATMPEYRCTASLGRLQPRYDLVDLPEWPRHARARITALRSG
jgi:hypothetical protein